MSIDWSTPPQLLLVALSIPAPTISIPQQLASTSCRMSGLFAGFSRNIMQAQGPVAWGGRSLAFSTQIHGFCRKQHLATKVLIILQQDPAHFLVQHSAAAWIIIIILILLIVIAPQTTIITTTSRPLLLSTLGPTTETLQIVKRRVAAAQQQL
jgi:hypothetical protein